MKLSFPLTCILIVSAFLMTNDLVAQNTKPRIKYNFNSNWKIFAGDAKEASSPGFNDDSWKTVTLPYAWNEDDAFKKRYC